MLERHVNEPALSRFCLWGAVQSVGFLLLFFVSCTNIPDSVTSRCGTIAIPMSALQKVHGKIKLKDDYFGTFLETHAVKGLQRIHEKCIISKSCMPFNITLHPNKYC